METLKDTSVFKFSPNTLESIRKYYGLDQPGRMEEALKILEKWIEKQDHFVKKKFDRDYLERLIIYHKGQLERVKKRIDLKCTIVNKLKFMAPFCLKDLKIFEFGYNCLLPKLTKDNYRIYLIKIQQKESKEIPFSAAMECLKYVALGFEYVVKNDYNVGFYTILDLREANLTNLVKVVSSCVTDLREFARWAVVINGIRCKQLHIITNSKLVEILPSISRSVSKTQNYEIFTHADLESLHKVVPRELLPADYGGDEENSTILEEKLHEAMSTKEFTKHMEFIREATTDESRRLDTEFTEEYEYLGIQGTFRSLVVD